jgi:hypothetical protein
MQCIIYSVTISETEDSYLEQQIRNLKQNIKVNVEHNMVRIVMQN